MLPVIIEDSFPIDLQDVDDQFPAAVEAGDGTCRTGRVHQLMHGRTAHEQTARKGDGGNLQGHGWLPADWIVGALAPWWSGSWIRSATPEPPGDIGDSPSWLLGSERQSESLRGHHGGLSREDLFGEHAVHLVIDCLLYTSDAADEED